jgi:hypothetical protein
LKWTTDNVNHDLHGLDSDPSEEEIKVAVMATAPGSDGYIGAFFKSCYRIVKQDLVAAIMEIFAHRDDCWNLLNFANVVLLEKKDGAQPIGDYRLISIMHSVGKLLTKILASRLSPHLDNLVSQSQSAFIKSRSIHDNFQYVKGVVNHFHRIKIHMLFLKLDIAKAFNSVRWEYLLEVMERLRFSPKWRDIMALIWSTTTSRILLNGQPGHPIKHANVREIHSPLCCSSLQ